jgi:hypothetical protein
MLKLIKNNPLTIWQLQKSAKKKIPLYEENKSEEVKVPFLDITANKQRYLKFSKLNGEWCYTEIVD